MLRRHLFCAASAMLMSEYSALQGALSGKRLGLAIHSYSNRWKAKPTSLKYPPFQDVLDVMDHCHSIGVSSLQISVQDWDRDKAQKARASSESYDMNLEGIIRLPQAPGDVPRFTQELRLGREAGARVFCAAMGGRRFEIFTQMEDFERWKVSTLAALALAEPVARRLGAYLAVENHQDFEMHELLALVKKVASKHVGICLDTGNNLALLEVPMAVVEALAPYAFTVHLKDISIRSVAAGFEMAEVPLGKGIFDLPAMVNTIRRAAPLAEFHLEMTTRNPLLIPCLSEQYWTTFPQKPGVDLVRTLALAQQQIGKKSLMRISELSSEARLNLEETNILESLYFAAEKLGFSSEKMKALKVDE